MTAPSDDARGAVSWNSATAAILQQIQAWPDPMLEAWLRRSLRAGRFAPLPASKTTPDVLHFSESVRRYEPALGDRLRPLFAKLIAEWGPHDGRPMLRDILILASELRAVTCLREVEALLRSTRLRVPREQLRALRAQARRREGAGPRGAGTSAPPPEDTSPELADAAEQVDLIKLALNVVAGVGPGHVSESWLLGMFEDPELMPIAYSALYRRDMEHAYRLLPQLIDTLRADPFRLGTALARLLTEYVQRNEVKHCFPRLLEAAHQHWDVLFVALETRGFSLGQVGDPWHGETFQLFRSISIVASEELGGAFEVPDASAGDIRALGECTLRRPLPGLENTALSVELV